MRKTCFLTIFLIVSLGFVFSAPFYAAAEQKGKTRRAAPPIAALAIDTSARLALVIGNSTYEFSPLKNPVNDASDLALALKDLGFTVILKKNADLRAMEEALEEFGNRLKRGGVGLFFYAGHGVQVQMTNYLIPVGAKVNKESDVKYVALDAEKILDEMAEANNGLNIVVLDACRDNPFGRKFRSASRGLAGISTAPLGTFISYSTGPGKVARDGETRNSPYTSALLETIQQPGLTIEQVFKGVRQKIISATGGEQIPWELSSLQGEFYFNPASRVNSKSKEGKQTAGLAVQDREEDNQYEVERKKIDEERRRLEVERTQLEKDRKRIEQEQKLEEERQKLVEEKKRIEEEKQVLAEKKAKKQAVNTDMSTFVPLKGDLSKYDPNNITNPTGDTIKFAVWDSISGPNAYLGEAYRALLGFVAQDINSQGGIKVDGKMKKIQMVFIDTQSAPDPARRALEKAILQDKIIGFSGVAGTHIAKLGQSLAKEYKTIFVNVSAYSDELNFLPDFNEYYFRTCGNSSTTAKSLAIFYKNRPETKFYILAQDYVWGHESTEIFEKTMKEVKPNAKIVGREFFPVFAKDFAPYLEKVRASGAEVVVTMAWGADNENLIKQSRQLGIKSPLNPDLFIPMASPFLDDTRPLEVIGGPAGRGLVLCGDFHMDRKLPAAKKLNDTWNKLWKTWKAPYNTPLYQWMNGGWYRNLTGYYWFFQAVQKAGSTKPEKIIAAWEGDTFDAFGWKHYMRPDDHMVIADRPIEELEFPNMWERVLHAAPGTPQWIPAKDCMPAFDEKLKGRTKK